MNVVQIISNKEMKVENQLKVIEQVLARIQPALSRALDFGVYHGIDPLSGDVAADISANIDQVTPDASKLASS